MRKIAWILLTASWMELASAAEPLSSETNPICQIRDNATLLRAEVDDTPNYFFRTMPDSDRICYNGSGTNIILDLRKGSRTRVPGPFDPVPLWNEKVLTTPMDYKNSNSNDETQKALTFFSLQGVEKPNTNLEDRDPIYKDPEMNGNYQSVGLLSSSPSGEEAYRIALVTPKGAAFRNYRYRPSTDNQPITIEPVGNVVSVCPGMDLKLPMLSKDGKRFSGLDVSSKPRSTKIFKIGDDGSCELEHDLGFETGKVDFSFDGKKLAFHIKATPEDTVEFYDNFRGIPTDTYVLDLESKRLRQLTANPPGSSSYFPVFRRDGKVVYIDDRDENFSFVVADPNRGEGYDYRFKYLNQNGVCAECFPQNSPEQKLSLLGEQWKSVCKHPDFNPILIAASLKKDQCLNLVRNYWNQLSVTANRAAVTRPQLEAVCSTLKSSAPAQLSRPPGKKPAQDGPSSVTADNTFNRKCQFCHTNIPFSDSEILRKQKSTTHPERTLAEEMLRRIISDGPDHMPRGGNLTQEELQVIRKELTGQ